MLFLSCLEQYQAHHRHSVNAHWVSEWMNKWLNNSFHCYLPPTTVPSSLPAFIDAVSSSWAVPTVLLSTLPLPGGWIPCGTLHKHGSPILTSSRSFKGKNNLLSLSPHCHAVSTELLFDGLSQVDQDSIWTFSQGPFPPPVCACPLHPQSGGRSSGCQLSLRLPWRSGQGGKWDTNEIQSEN